MIFKPNWDTLLKNKKGEGTQSQVFSNFCLTEGNHFVKLSGRGDNFFRAIIPFQ